MAGSVNKVILIGNLGADPEIRRTQDGRPIANLRIATTDTWRDRNTGERLGYPYNQGYGGKNKLDLGMGKVPRVASYHGFVFGSFAEEGPSLVEHLGAAAGEIDRLAGFVASHQLVRIEHDPDRIRRELAAPHPPLDRRGRFHRVRLASIDLRFS